MRPVTTAIVIAGLITTYLIGGTIYSLYKNANKPVRAPHIEIPFLVQTTKLQAQTFTQEATVRGHSEALKKVVVKAEVEGRVISTPFEPGSKVNQGAILCQLEPNERIATLEESRAILVQKQLEFDQAKALMSKGHRSQSQLATAKAQLDGALAGVHRRELDLANTYIKAPFSGKLDSRLAEIGTFLVKGNGCAVLMQVDPFLAVGEVSEALVSMIKVGGLAKANISGIGNVEGTIRFVSSIANSNTRAYRVEMLLNNPNGQIRDGMTTSISIPLKVSQAHFIPSSALVLGQSGQLGIRAVVDGSVVFHAVKILEDEENGIWVFGLPDSLELITVGQDFVSSGQKVRTNKTEPNLAMMSETQS